MAMTPLIASESDYQQSITRKIVFILCVFSFVHFIEKSFISLLNKQQTGKYNLGQRFSSTGTAYLGARGTIA